MELFERLVAVDSITRLICLLANFLLVGPRSKKR
jgi:hypothetical protein